MNHEQFGKRIIDGFHQILPQSTLKQGGVWLDITQDFNLRRMVGWRGYPRACYVGLFNGGGPRDYVLELDLSLVVQSGKDSGEDNCYIWFLNPPTNTITTSVMRQVLGQMRDTDFQYRNSVRAAKKVSWTTGQSTKKWILFS